jgi:hypothetical protein
VLAVTRTPEIVVLDDEQHVPVQSRAHERHQACRNVRIDVDAWLAREPIGERRELGREVSHEGRGFEIQNAKFKMQTRQTATLETSALVLHFSV